QWLESFTGKASSRRVYAHTVEYGKRTFGRGKVRDLDTSDVERFFGAIRRAAAERRPPKKGEAPPEVSQATLAKHARQTAACLQAAVVAGYAEQNPVRLLHKSSRPRVPKSVPSYFTDDELARLWPELAERPLMLALCKTAVGTGARLGELAALRWEGDVDLLH